MIPEEIPEECLGAFNLPAMVDESDRRLGGIGARDLLGEQSSKDPSQGRGHDHRSGPPEWPPIGASLEHRWYRPRDLQQAARTPGQLGARDDVRDTALVVQMVQPAVADQRNTCTVGPCRFESIADDRDGGPRFGKGRGLGPV
jgi:hypothetical protein